MQCYKAAFILSLLFCPFLASAAGVAIAGTRVIYNEQSHEADITVKNTNPHDPVLIQSWVDDLADNNKSPFIVTPPLFRLDAGDSNDLRVLLTSAQLPNDRESLFTLNIKVIPANTAPAGENILQFAIKNQLKLIYRPAGLLVLRSTRRSTCAGGSAATICRRRMPPLLCDYHHAQLRGPEPENAA